MEKTLCGIQLDRSPAFQIVDGTEKYKVIDLVTGGESFHEEKIQAFLINVWGHNYRLEVR